MKAKIITAICLLVALLLIGNVSANSAVYVQAKSEGGEFDFTGDGDNWEWSISVEGFDIANTDVANNWGVNSNVRYEDIGEGTIYMKVNHYSRGDEFWYFNELQEIIDGNGNYTKGLPGGHSVQVSNSTNITGYIDYRERDHKAVFLRDTANHHADLTVIVHNGHLLENASVELLNGPNCVGWTDDEGVVELTPTGGVYGMLIEHEDYQSMLVDDLTFENDKRYLINVNLSTCESNQGKPLCAPDSESLLVYYKDKGPANNPISPQGYVNYFAERLTTCMAGRDKCASGTLEVMSRNWGIYPEPALGVLLYDCDFAKGECTDKGCEWNITYIVKNYQKDPYTYSVELICGDVVTPMNEGTLGPTFSTTAKETITKTVVIKCDNDQNSCGGQMYLKVLSNEVED